MSYAEAEMTMNFGEQEWLPKKLVWNGPSIARILS